MAVAAAGAGQLIDNIDRLLAEPPADFQRENDQSAPVACDNLGVFGFLVTSGCGANKTVLDCSTPVYSSARCAGCPQCGVDGQLRAGKAK